MYLLLELLLVAGLWNFLLITTAPQRMPQTLRLCVLTAGLEGVVIGGILLIIQVSASDPGGFVLFANSVRYALAWTLFSMVMKNQYRRLKLEYAARDTGGRPCNDEES